MMPSADLLLLPLLLFHLLSSPFPHSAAADTAAAPPGPSPDLKTRCSPDFEKLSDCLDYSTAKKDTPSDKCCKAVADIRGRDPACLCYIILQTGKTSPAASTFGLQYGRLLQLPTACRMTNANVSDCPRVLAIPAGSPDNAYFNGSAVKPANANATTGSGTDGSRVGAAPGQVHLSVGSVLVSVMASVLSSIL